MRFRICLWMIVFVAVLFPTKTTEAVVIIDDFTSGPVTFTARPDQFPAPFSQTGLDPERVLNGTRRVVINGVQGGMGDVVATVDATSENGMFVYDASAAFGTPPASGLIETMSIGAGDPNWNDPTSVFLVDLTANGSDRFAIEILDANIVGRSGRTTQLFNVRVASGDAGQRQHRFAGSFEIGSLSEGTTIYIPFTDASPFIEFDKVAYVEILTVNIGAGTSFRFGSIRSVPEPSALLMLMFALSAPFSARRSRGRYRLTSRCS